MQRRVRIDHPIGRALDERGIRRSWFARERLKIGPWTFSRILAGVQPAPAGFEERAALALGLPPDAFKQPTPIRKAA